MQVVLPPLPRPEGGFSSALPQHPGALRHRPGRGPDHLKAYLFMIVLVLGSFTVGAFTPDFLDEQPRHG